MGCVGREEEHAAFVDGDVAVDGFGGGGFDDFEEHRAFVLVEEFGGGVDMVVCAGVGAADDLWGGRISEGMGGGRRGELGERTITVTSSL